jgi:rubrerythrin
MNIRLIKGSHTTAEAIDLATQFIQVKIKFNENKIDQSANEEDIKMRENHIKQLLDQLHELKKTLKSHNGLCSIEADFLVHTN